MANPYPAVFRDDNSDTRLAGSVDFTDPSNQPSPVTRQEIAGNGVSIAGTGGDWLTWDQDAGPDALIDRSVPAHPTIIDAGVYLVSVIVGCASLAEGGYFDAGLHLDRTGFNASMYANSSQAAPAPNVRVSDVTLALAWYCPAGAQIGVFADNFSSVTQTFNINYGHIQRLA